MAAEPKSKSQKIWPFALMALVAFLCGAMLLRMMIWNADKLVALGLVGRFYYIVLIVLGLCAALCLFGVLESFARYKGEQFGGSLQLGGPIIAAVLVVFGGHYVAPDPSSFPFTVFVHGESGPSDVVLKNLGQVVLALGPEHRPAHIGNQGQAEFHGIASSFRGKEVPIWVESDDFETKEPNQKCHLDNDNLYLVVRRKSGRVLGSVQDDQGQAIAGAIVSVANLSTNTDSSGRFEFIIPGQQMNHELLMDVTFAGYERWHNSVVPNANAATIKLHRSP